MTVSMAALEHKPKMKPGLVLLPRASSSLYRKQEFRWNSTRIYNNKKTMRFHFEVVDFPCSKKILNHNIINYILIYYELWTFHRHRRLSYLILRITFVSSRDKTVKTRTKKKKEIFEILSFHRDNQMK